MELEILGRGEGEGRWQCGMKVTPKILVYCKEIVDH